MTRTRLSPEERRTQLLDLGGLMFASMPYEEVHIERVAEEAGVSRGLLYHYYPSKRAFFAALVQRHTEQMARDTAPGDVVGGPLAQLRHGVEVFLRHVRANPHGTRALHQGATSADEELRRLVADSQRLHEERILDVLAPEGAHDLLRLLTASWIDMLRSAGQQLIDHPDVSLEDTVEVLVQAFLAGVAALPADARPAGLDDLMADLDDAARV